MNPMMMPFQNQMMMGPGMMGPQMMGGAPKAARAAADPNSYGKVERALKIEYNMELKVWEKTEIKVQIAKGSFAKGGTRVVNKMKEIVNGKPLDQLFVAKFLDKSLFPPGGPMGPIRKEMYFEDVMMQEVCIGFTDEFNALHPPKKIAFLAAYVLELIDRPGKVWATVEPFLKGSYAKHNNNDGATYSNRHTPQAFSHFTFEKSGHQLLVCDIQGVDDHYTDPQIHSHNGKGFGLGNQGHKGLVKFLQSHTCNPVCQMVGLPVLKRGRPVPGSSAKAKPSATDSAAAVLAFQVVQNGAAPHPNAVVDGTKRQRAQAEKAQRQAAAAAAQAQAQAQAKAQAQAQAKTQMEEPVKLERRPSNSDNQQQWAAQQQRQQRQQPAPSNNGLGAGMENAVGFPAGMEPNYRSFIHESGVEYRMVPGSEDLYEAVKMPKEFEQAPMYYESVSSNASPLPQAPNVEALANKGQAYGDFVDNQQQAAPANAPSLAPQQQGQKIQSKDGTTYGTIEFEKEYAMVLGGVPGQLSAAVSIDAASDSSASTVDKREIEILVSDMGLDYEKLVAESIQAAVKMFHKGSYAHDRHGRRHHGKGHHGGKGHSNDGHNGRSHGQHHQHHEQAHNSNNNSNKHSNNNNYKGGATAAPAPIGNANKPYTGVYSDQPQNGNATTGSHVTPQPHLAMPQAKRPSGDANNHSPIPVYTASGETPNPNIIVDHNNNIPVGSGPYVASGNQNQLGYYC